ncbi:coproporphyrinogen III oxidase [Anaerocolumna cellulosilytica]|uniref:Coproporphyrinogen III oxidase n=1 Tax=Anaerocolumna cellulosilytica TaxID=433286 RepID=A0A6S6R075_9FIRM|nr:coproporphyrinogen dehydrogenase HemZ [Anaerocolumna cellulosilytica]MBB5194543.1 oxygen-independent coproporphyrinogen-3 oxidase [Anaerocolumna cellulosilytica]BCJ93487.1 coproporphyrinogen III oxidase [Anaerocolumna cellulosilytica]
MITIYLLNEDFEYDIHALTKAFYPKETIKVIKKSFDIFELIEERTGNLVLCKEEEELKIYLSITKGTICLAVLKDGAERITYEEKIKDGSKSALRNSVKQLLYNSLSKLSGYMLPWGTLTGVRPTKIALELLENGVKDDEIENRMKEVYYCSQEKTKLSLLVAQKEYELLKEIDYQNSYSIYIGIPFCPSTCLYCSFTSYSLERSGHLMEEYLQALYKEITFAGTCLKEKKLITVYLGGGTPTTLTAKQLDGLLNHIKTNLTMSAVVEFTVEAGRPDSITKEKLLVLKKHGISRISINPQTMNQNTLDAIGRKHTVEEVKKAFLLARECGHDNINMDLIIGLPLEDEKQVEYTLQEIGALKPDSLTIHTLALKRAARLNTEKQSYQDIHYGDAKKMLFLTQEFARIQGYEPYYLYRQKNMAENLENTGYALKGKEGLYNILIMEDKQTILALGAGALSKFIFPKENRIERVENVKSLKDYIERIDEMIERKHRFLLDNNMF